MPTHLVARALSVGLAVLLAATPSAAQEGERAPRGLVEAPGDGIQIGARDADWSMRIRARVMLLLETGDLAEPDVEARVRRGRISLEGAIIDRHVRYRLQLGLALDDMEADDEGHPRASPLLDAWVELEHLRDLRIRVGQYVLPFARERIVSSSRFALVERNPVGEELGLDRDVGVSLRSEDLFGLDLLRYEAGVSLGDGRRGDPFDEHGLLWHARLELYPLGLFDSYVENDVDCEDEPRLAIGVGWAFVDEAPFDRGVEGRVPEDGGTTDLYQGVADLIVLWRGVSFAATFAARRGDRDAGDASAAVSAPRDGWGASVQLGWVVPWAPLAVAARFAALEPFSLPSSLPRSREVASGLSWYFAGDPVKLQADVVVRWGDELPDPATELRVMFQGSI